VWLDFAEQVQGRSWPPYAQRHLEHSDYYDEHRRVQGEWHGRGAELLGLRGEVAQKQFEAVREGLHPET
jgi:hypothetical protein